MSNRSTIYLNVLAKDVENARQIAEATNRQVFVGVMVKNFKTVEAAIKCVQAYQAAGVPVSVGLGAGDPAQWHKVAQVVVKTKPDHVNQVFPAAGYTKGALDSVDSSHTIVNALIAPSGIPGKVSILTGPDSRQYQELVSCDAAAVMLKEIGVQSVKFYPVDGDKRLEEIAAMVKAAVRQGITIFEPTGGIDAHSVYKVVETCRECGAQTIIPHIYTAFVNKETGVTSPEDVALLIRALTK